MIHYGDITKIHGDQVPAVHVITGGSPCQDLSVAGKRAGLAGERSGLFMEQIRIVKEMRENDRRNYAGADNADRLIRPRFMVWENVPGAFSSNKGEDFRAVLEETAKVADKNAVIPGPEGGRWRPCGLILGDGWSIAWRVHDAQYWGVPQRRKRICLLADFNGDTAGKILFELQRETTNRETEQAVADIGTESRSEVQSVSKGLSGDIAQGGKEGERVTEDTERCTNEAGGIYDVRISSDGTKNWRAHCYETDKSRALDTGGEDPDSNHGGIVVVAYGIGSYDSNAMKSDNPHSGIYEADTSRTLDNNGGNPACNQGGMMVVTIDRESFNAGENFDRAPGVSEDGIMPTLVSSGPGAVAFDAVAHAPVVIEGNGSRPSHQGDGYAESETMYTLNSTEHHAVCIEKNGTLAANARKSLNSGNVVRCESVVRRLTPLECERLQNFPDNWTNIGDWVDSKGKTHKGDSDSPRYKALGNSIALPFWQWMAERMMPYLPENPTMASLFSGIGGFELVFARAGCKPVWASEVEEFAIAVTKKRFPEE